MLRFAALLALASIPSLAAAYPPAAVMVAQSHGKSSEEKEKERRAARPTVDVMIGTIVEQGRIASTPGAGPPPAPRHAPALAARELTEEEVEERLGARSRSPRELAARSGSARATAAALCAQGSEALLLDSQLAGLCGSQSFRLGSSSRP